MSFTKKIFAKKTLVLISNNKIRNFEISTFSQVAVVTFAILVMNLFYKSTIYNEIIDAKTLRISKLQKSNYRFQRELKNINNNLEKINSYFVVSSGYENSMDKDFQDAGLHDEKFTQIVQGLNLEENYKKTAIEIASANVILDSIQNLAKKRIKNLEKRVMSTGIKVSQEKVKDEESLPFQDEPTYLSLNTKEELLKQGGPFEEAWSTKTTNDSSIEIQSVNIDDEITYLSNLEKFIYHAPLSKPMKNYYVSSGFGTRTDPIKRIRARHNGMDFVGSKENEEILSPSYGEVKMAGTFGAYGKTVIVDHGYGITTRYGHLKEIKVRKGDIVKRGQVIALQGNSGRSTGHHLHYEVRYKNKPLNPRKFLQVGEDLFEEI